MDAIRAYFENIKRIYDEILDTQLEALEQAAQTFAQAALNGHNLFAFGCSHAGLVTLDLYYRTGGMALFNPVRAPGLNLDIDPATMTSQMERLADYGRVIIDHQPIGAGDVLVIHSVSGRNTVTIDAALRAKEIGATVVALTNLNTAHSVTSRHPSGKMLHDIADIVLDNRGCIGDSSLEIEGVPEKVAPTSTAVGAAMLNAAMARAVQLIVAGGAVPPVFVSANVEGGDAHNQAMLARYRDHIFYMG